MIVIVLTSAELRAEIARRQIKLYLLAAAVGVNPGRLGQILRGSLPLSAAMADRIKAALEALP